MKPVIIVGAGGHAKVLLDVLLCSERKVIGLTDFDKKKWGSLVNGVPVLGGDEVVFSYNIDEIELVNGMGSVGSMNKRKNIYEYFKNKEYLFSNVIHPSAIVSSNAVLANGVQLLPGCIVNAGAFIGDNSIVNTRASIDHDVSIGSHVHIAPGVTISGGATIGDCTHIGTGATVIQGVHIGSNVLIGAGAVVVKDIPDNCKAYGVPAREV